MSFDSTYIQKGLQDGSGYKFYVRSKGVQKQVYIYGKEGPSQLYALAAWIEALKAHKTKEFKPTTRQVDFGKL